MYQLSYVSQLPWLKSSSLQSTKVLTGTISVNWEGIERSLPKRSCNSTLWTGNPPMKWATAVTLLSDVAQKDIQTRAFHVTSKESSDQ